VVAERVCTFGFGCIAHSACGPGWNAFVLLAQLSEKYELWPQALEYCDAAMDPDLKKGGCELPLVRTIALTTKGRALAALDRIFEAAEALEAAGDLAHSTEMWMLEALALLDLKLCVLDSMGHADHGSRRLGAVLRLLSSPAELLTPMLKGLDAAELMSLGAPEAGYEVVYIATEDAATAALREELQGLGLRELRRRAKKVGVDEETLEQALDADEPKVVAIQLLLSEAIPEGVPPAPGRK
jgi:tetratricopeptide (TPR) repeat protein